MTHYDDKAVEENRVTNYAAADLVTLIAHIAETMKQQDLLTIEAAWHDRNDRLITVKVRR